MNLRAYYQKIREMAAELEPEGASVWLTSLATPDGGRAGVVVEAPRELAAKLIVEGKSRKATPDEVARETKRQAGLNPVGGTTDRLQVELNSVTGPAKADRRKER